MINKLSNTTPFFSIIIPTYNRAHLILKTLNSVFTQSFENYEIIVVDNKSTDNITEVLKDYIDTYRIQFIQHDKNYERAKSRNTGLNHAKGKYVTFLDSDDLLYENCLLDIFNHLNNSDFKDDIIHTRYEFVDSNNKKIQVHQRKLLSNYKKNICVGNFLACIGVFLSEDVYRKYRFNESPSLTGSEDWEFWLRILSDVESIGFVDKVNCAIVEHTGRTVNQQNIQQLIQRRLNIIEQINNDPHLSIKYKPYLNILSSSSFLYIASNTSGQGNKSISIKFLIKALISNPKFIFSPRTYAVLKNIALKW